MKIFLKKYFPAIPVVIILASMIFSHSCANTTTPPSGGPKDTIPPVITKISPGMGSVNVPVHGTKLEIEFNEEEKKIHVSVKDNDYIAYLALLAVSGDTVFVMTEENGWLQIEFFVESGQTMRAWVPERCVSW